jgi:hypothetical protein
MADSDETERMIEAASKYIQDHYGPGSGYAPGGLVGGPATVWVTTADGRKIALHATEHNISYNFQLGGGGAGGGGGGGSSGGGGGGGGWYPPGGGGWYPLGGAGGGGAGIPQYPAGGGAGGSWSPSPSYAGGGAGGGGGIGGSYSVVNRYGEDGFGDTGLEEPPTAAGFVTGYRWWKLSVPDFRGSPAHAELEWQHGPLQGMRAPWEIGQSVPYRAVCLAGDGRSHPNIPGSACGCGFWAYWHPEDRKMNGPGEIPVFGVIKGFGRTRLGWRGFRVEKARILALHLAFTLLPFVDRGYGFDPQMTVRTMDDGRQMLIPSSVSYAEAQAALAHAEAWVAVIGDRLEQDYPGVVICETRDRLLTAFPPDETYANRAPRSCVWCGDPAPEYGHELYCSGRNWDIHGRPL